MGLRARFDIVPLDHASIVVLLPLHIHKVIHCIEVYGIIYEVGVVWHAKTWSYCVRNPRSIDSYILFHYSYRIFTIPLMWAVLCLRYMHGAEICQVLQGLCLKCSKHFSLKCLLARLKSCTLTTVHAMTKFFVLFCSAQDGESADMNCFVF